jgi:hypothetical protein
MFVPCGRAIDSIPQLCNALTLSAELLAAVDFGDAMSNPLHKNIDSLWAALDS